MSEFVDAQAQSFETPLTTDICIVGAGAAGITLARSLAQSNLNVLLLESGNLDLEARTQALFQGEVRGINYYDLTACRLRYFGGTTNHWAGFCRPYTQNAFAGRPELGVPAWPINEQDLNPYIAKAAHDLGLKMEGFSLEYQAKQLGVNLNDLPDRRSTELVTQVYQLTERVRQGKYWRDNLRQQRNLQVLLHANVTHINMNASGTQVESLKVQALDKKPFQVKARWYVLAAHGIENARLLLDSDDVVKGGIGNAHDHVGRYFMEHPKMISGRFIPNKNFPSIYNGGNAHQVFRNLNIGLSPEVMHRERVLDYYCRFLPAYDYEKTHFAAEDIKEGFWKPADAKALRALGRIVGDLPSTYQYLLSRWNIQPDQFDAFDLDHRIEQAPNPESRVTLSQQRDALGCRKVILNWQFTDLDYKTYAVGQSYLIKELTRLKMGTFVAPPLTPEAIRTLVMGNRHHIGTTRMSANAKDGVVDPDLKVHGTDNLFVASSGVFTNGGHTVPTMIIMAFAIRLANHLTRLGKST
ncbi:MAG: GMC family oxidoreductase [Burkholderiales bacterium]|nr:GMC family oxidoreductase [Burkholderiales bacterium]